MSDPRKPVNWAAIAVHLLHPRKVEIIKALAYIGQPMSPTDLFDILCIDDGDVTAQQVNHHVVHMLEHGVLTIFDGDMEIHNLHNIRRIYYTLAPEVLG